MENINFKDYNKIIIENPNGKMVFTASKDYGRVVSWFQVIYRIGQEPKNNPYMVTNEQMGQLLEAAKSPKAQATIKFEKYVK